MKYSKPIQFKLTALFLCFIMLLPMIFACGDKSENNNTGSTTDGNGETVVENLVEAETDPPVTDPPTDPPTQAPTDPPTTEEPFVLQPIDPNLPYWDQIANEISQYGLTGGNKVLNGDDEAEVMKKFRETNCKREEIDISGENVPFSVAYRVTVTKDGGSYAEAEYKAMCAKDVPLKQDDLIVGVMWIRGQRLGDSDNYSMGDDPQYYFAVKSMTDSSATEGNCTPSGGQVAYSEWHKVFFYGHIINEEDNSRNIDVRVFVGYGHQQLDFGGIMAYCFPYSRENEAAAIKLVDSNK